MPNTLSSRPRTHTVLRFARVPVHVPEEATPEQTEALTADALYRAYTAAARRAGARPRPQLVGEQPRPRAAYPAGPPSPNSARTVPEFLDRMRALRRWAKISFEKLEQLGGKDGDGASRLPHSTINRLLAKTNASRLPDHDQLAAFVLACGLSEEQWREWALVCADIESTGGDKGLRVYPVTLEQFRHSPYAGFPLGDTVPVGGAAPTFTRPMPSTDVAIIVDQEPLHSYHGRSLRPVHG